MDSQQKAGAVIVAAGSSQRMGGVDKMFTLLGEKPRPVKDLVEATGERQAKISQHLAIMRQRGIVHTQRIGTEIHYSLADPRILEACHITREVLLQQLTRQASLAAPLA